ncbi:NUDIX domain-containing protein [Paenibacillus xylanexedens]|uniref:NUDIX hydrolase n=1 Tax=Paenibacillus xylanexedens TaxID=528191 RepID=UPI00119F0E6D|nr:NUDIX domain-containing protein [Paenibacillus xylanexedens]
MTPERFDFYDNQQNWLGTAPRTEVHAKGYWHRSFHCWIVRDEGAQRMVLFQRRRDIKDTFPLYYDITAAGHLTAGEQLHEASRELEEELGVQAAFETLTYLLTAKQELQGEVRGVPFIDREFSSVYGLCLYQSLEDYILQPSEVHGLYEVALDDLLALFRGEREVIEANGIRMEIDLLASSTTQSTEEYTELGASDDEPSTISSVRETVTVHAHEFVPHGEEYYISVLEALYDVPSSHTNT